MKYKFISQLDIMSYMLEGLIWKRQKGNVGEGVKKKESSFTAMGV